MNQKVVTITINTSAKPSRGGGSYIATLNYQRHQKILRESTNVRTTPNRLGLNAAIKAIHTLKIKSLSLIFQTRDQNLRRAIEMAAHGKVKGRNQDLKKLLTRSLREYGPQNLTVTE